MYLLITCTIVIDNWFHAHTTAGRKRCGDGVKCWVFADRDCVAQRRYQLQEMQLVHEAPNPNVVITFSRCNYSTLEAQRGVSIFACMLKPRRGATRTELISLCDLLYFGCKLIICSCWGVAVACLGCSEDPRFSSYPRGYEASLRW